MEIVAPLMTMLYSAFAARHCHFTVSVTMALLGPICATAFRDTALPKGLLE
jgi:hypothetical protein